MAERKSIHKPDGNEQMPKVTKSLFLCPQCGEPARVISTRSSGPQRLVRYRACENDHRFSTKEVPIDEPHQREKSIANTTLRFAIADLLELAGIDANQDSDHSKQEGN